MSSSGAASDQILLVMSRLTTRTWYSALCTISLATKKCNIHSIANDINSHKEYITITFMCKKLFTL